MVGEASDLLWSFFFRNTPDMSLAKMYELRCEISTFIFIFISTFIFIFICMFIFSFNSIFMFNSIDAQWLLLKLIACEMNCSLQLFSVAPQNIASHKVLFLTRPFANEAVPLSSNNSNSASKGALNQPSNQPIQQPTNQQSNRPSNQATK